MESLPLPVLYCRYGEEDLAATPVGESHVNVDELFSASSSGRRGKVGGLAFVACLFVCLSCCWRSELS